jgi:hypothetical protein
MGLRSEFRFRRRLQPLVEITIETHPGWFEEDTEVAIPLASAEVCLRIPQRAMDRLVDVFALPRFRIPAHEDTHQPGALTSGNDLSGLACHHAYLARILAHNWHTFHNRTPEFC